jgi:tartrate dehydrogenase/decarboxylase/D-malate dehydrogenase
LADFPTRATSTALAPPPRQRPHRKTSPRRTSNSQANCNNRFPKFVEYRNSNVIKGDYPDVATDKMLVDAMTTRMVLRPGTLDTIVATNLHADVLSDLAAALTGSLGLAPTANLNPERTFPSMFEPIHGSAFDIMGQGIANQIGAFWSAALMLEHLGEPAAATALIAAIEQVTGAGRVLPRDLGGEATTAQVTEAVIGAIEGANA